jgi:hypothetical protein
MRFSNKISTWSLCMLNLMSVCRCLDKHLCIERARAFMLIGVFCLVPLYLYTHLYR